ncbi:phytoene/squalene synthase family protein [Sphingomonas sp. JC676]|uniref:phytoene/squalene synthase family protein n=1 Tax=Sphingomonas sp. JC676 TaxID=2768065 RepID=UPI0016582616|nr:phytoene/squalene synthase family protein [Sphingomonas sp. JC676]MBC9034667.1 phytoene/squalene synthase family protein [Sphingomonas sp. JC676]
MTALPARDAIVATAGESIARGSKSFAAASRLFAPAVRERAWLLYAWCRRCDDLADGQDHGHDTTPVADPNARLAGIRERTAAALNGQWVGDAAFDALRIVVGETGIPQRLVWDVVEGFALDAAGWRPASEADLMRYCYHVAGAVGCMMAVVMGVRPDDDALLDQACDLGLGFQLANIARDLGEDAEAGRCYLPADWLAEAGIAPDAVTADREKLAALAARLCAMAEAYEASARRGTPALGFRSAWAVLAATGIYGDIARAVEARGPAAWDRRVSTSAGAKLGWIARAFGEARLRVRLYPPQPRTENLWTRPR